MAKKRRPHDNKPTEAPTCSCLLLCDDVVISMAHDKHVLHGVIGTIGVESLPGLAGNFVTYVRVSNVYESQTIRVRFENASNGDILWETEAKFVSKKDPLEVHTLIAKVGIFELKQSGRYILSAVYNDVPLAQMPVQVVAIGH